MSIKQTQSLYKPDYQRSTTAPTPAHPTAPRLSRNAAVYLISILSLLLVFAGYGLAALILPAAFGVLLSLTRTYSDTTETTYRILGLRLKGDKALDAYAQRRRWQVEKNRGGVIRAWAIMSPEGRRVAWELMNSDERALVIGDALVRWGKKEAR